MLCHEKKKEVYLNISQIASYVAKNPYDSVSPFENLWKRCDSEEYNKILNQLNKELLEHQIEHNTIKVSKEVLCQELQSKNITKRQFDSKMKDIGRKEIKTEENIRELSQKVDNVTLTKTEQIQKVLGSDAVLKIQDTHISTDAKRQATNTLIEERDDISEESKKHLLKKTENLINTTQGTLFEDSALVQFEQKFGVKLDTSQQYHKMRVDLKNDHSSFEWFIGGKVDGLYVDISNPKNSYIVEVKTRMKGFFSSLRDYEKCQIQLYMYVLRLDQAKLVEKYKKKIKVTTIYRDNDFIEEIIESLQIFARNFEGKFLISFKLKQDYMNKTDNEKKIFINKLYLSEISQYLQAKLERNVMELEASEDCLIDDLD